MSNKDFPKFEDPSLLSLPHTNMNIRPKQNEREALISLLLTLTDHINYEKLQESGKLPDLFDLCTSLSESHPQIFPELKYRISSHTQCSVCASPCPLSHSCGFALCPVHVPTNKMCCLSCNQPLSSSYLSQLFENSGKCTVCHSRKPCTDCKHLCKRCLMNLKDTECPCETCIKSYREMEIMNHQCYICRKHFSPIRDAMVSICEKHIVCSECARNCITKGICMCGARMSIEDIELYYKNYFVTCSNCGEHFSKHSAETRHCCGSFICKFCQNSYCNSCRASAINISGSLNSIS